MNDDGTMPGRIIQVLDALTRAGPQSLGELTRETGLPRSTAYRIAEDLRRRDVLVKMEDRYELGSRILSWGCRALAENKLRSAAAPLLAELHHRSRNLVWLCRADGEDTQIIDRSIPTGARGAYTARMWPQSLHRAGLLLAAGGQAAVADHPDLVERLLGEGIPRPSRYSPQGASKIIERIKKCRETGHAIDREEFLLGWACVAASIRDESGRTVGVIGITGRSTSFDPTKHAAHVLAGADTIGARLVPEPSHTRSNKAASHLAAQTSGKALNRQDSGSEA